MVVLTFFKTKEDRTRAGNALRKFWSDRLHDGLYNPFGKRKAPAEDGPSNITEAIERVIALKTQSLKKKSIRGYKESANLLLLWINERKLQKLRTKDFSGKNGAELFLTR